MAQSLKKRIDAFCKADSKVNERLHVLLVDILVHSQKHGECSMVAHLMNNLESARRKGAIIAWISNHAPIAVSKDKTTKAYSSRFTKKPKNWAGDEFKLEEAQTTPYWNREDTEEKQVLLDAAKVTGSVMALAKRIERALEEGKANGADVIKLRDYASNLKKLATNAA